MFHQDKFDDNINEFNATFLGYLEQVLEEILNANPELDLEKPSKVKGSTVFIIHGHDKEIKQELQLLLKNAGVQNVVLHELADKGRPVIIKLLEETEHAGYAIALLTPDDVMESGGNRASRTLS